MEVAVVNDDLVVNVLTSPTFKHALTKAGNRTRRTGHETSFAVMKKYASDDLGVPWVHEGGCGAMWLGRAPEEIYSMAKRSLFALLTDSYPLLSIHFHTTYDEPVKPSPTDLYGIHEGCYHEGGEGRYEVRTIEGIGQVDPRGDVELLLIQPLLPFCPGEGEERVFEKLLPSPSTEEVANLLTLSGIYIAEVINFHRWQLKGSDRQKLGKFAFTPRRISSVTERDVNYQGDVSPQSFGGSHAHQCDTCRNMPECVTKGIFGQEVCGQYDPMPVETLLEHASFRREVLLERCPNCGSYHDTNDCEDNPSLADNTVGHCLKCRTCWCLVCGYVFQAAEDDLECPHWEVCAVCSKEQGYLDNIECAEEIYYSDYVYDDSDYQPDEYLRCPSQCPYHDNISECPTIEVFLEEESNRARW